MDFLFAMVLETLTQVPHAGIARIVPWETKVAAQLQGDISKLRHALGVDLYAGTARTLAQRPR